MNFSLHMAFRQITKNKRKSVPIFLCMFMSVFLLINLLGLYESYEQMILEDTKESYGAYHFLIQDAKPEWKTVLQNNPDIEMVGTESVVSSVPISQFNSAKIKKEQTLKITNMDAYGMLLNSLRLKSGRLPEKEGEILISAGVELGDGYAYDKAIHGGTVYVNDSKGKKESYQVVGILDNFNAAQLDETYLALVKQNQNGKKINLYVTVKNAEKCKEIIHNVASTFGIDSKKIYLKGDRVLDKEGTWTKYQIIGNAALISLQNKGTSDDTAKSVEYITQILVVFVILVAFLIIWNVYMLLFEKRREEYGLLRVCGFSPRKIYVTTWLESGILYLCALILGVIFGSAGKLIVQRFVQTMRISSMEHLKMTISLPIICLSAGIVFLVVFLTVTMLTHHMMNSSPVEMLSGNKKEKKYRRRIFNFPIKPEKKYQPTAEFVIGKRNILRKKGRTCSIVLSLCVVVVFFVTFCSFIEVLDSQIVTDVSMIPSCQYKLFTKDVNEKFPQEFLERIPYTEFKYTTSSTDAVFHISPDIKNRKLLQYYNDYHPGETNEKIFNEEKVYVEIDGISKEQFENFKWFEGKPMSYEEWVQSGKALLDDIYVKTDSDGNKSYGYQLTIPSIDYVFEYDETNIKWNSKEKSYFPAGKMTMAGRVGNKLYCREDNMIYISVFLPESVVREKYDPYSQIVYINAQKGKETELGAWLRSNALKYNYTIMDDVKKYAAAHDTQTTIRIVLFGVLIAVVFISMFHVYNTVRSNLITRKKELAILMALGMKRFQIQKSILWEHAAYGVIGGLAGGGLSILLLRKLLEVLSGASKIYAVIPWDYLIMGFCGVIALSMLVSFLATINLAKTSIVEEIREND